jgi:hypothetical protein
MQNRTSERRPYATPKLTRFGTIRERTLSSNQNSPFAGSLFGGASGSTQNCAVFGTGAYCWS